MGLISPLPWIKLNPFQHSQEEHIKQLFIFIGSVLFFYFSYFFLISRDKRHIDLTHLDLIITVYCIICVYCIIIIIISCSSSIHINK